MRPIGNIGAARKYGALVAALVGLSMLFVARAAAAPPQITSPQVTAVSATGVTLAAEVKPHGLVTTFRYEYLTLGACEANLAARPARDSFAGATVPQHRGTGSAGVGSSPNRVGSQISELAPETAYRYRLLATNSEGESVSTGALPFGTQPPTNAFELLDHRGWVMVSPIEKAGGAIQPPGEVSGGGVFQAAAGSGSFTFSSADSFGGGAPGAPPGSQYAAARGSTGWSTANVTTPIASGSYGSEPDGVPYQLFSGDLGLGLLSNGERCRGVAGGQCLVANPPLPGTGASGGYRNYYRLAASGGFEWIVTGIDLAHASLGPQQFELRLVAATPDLAHLILSSCAALASGANEVSAPGGCDPADQNLYEWSGGPLSLINILPGETDGTPAAQIAAPTGALSSNGSLVYFTSGGGLYLRAANGTTKAVGMPGSEFAGGSADGSLAYLIDSGPLQEVLGSRQHRDDGRPRCYARAGGVRHIQPSTTQNALKACGSSLVGTGRFAAKVLIPQQASFPAGGKLYAFNGRYEGHPAILAHVYGTEPVPTSFTLPFVMSARKGELGPVLTASVAEAARRGGYITELTLDLGGAGSTYLVAGCPTPKGFGGAAFPFAKATFDFGQRTINSTLPRNCTARG